MDLDVRDVRALALHRGDDRLALGRIRVARPGDERLIDLGELLGRRVGGDAFAEDLPAGLIGVVGPAGGVKHEYRDGHRLQDLEQPVLAAAERLLRRGALCLGLVQRVGAPPGERGEHRDNARSEQRRAARRVVEPGPLSREPQPPEQQRDYDDRR